MYVCMSGAGMTRTNLVFHAIRSPSGARGMTLENGYDRQRETNRVTTGNMIKTGGCLTQNTPCYD